MEREIEHAGSPEGTVEAVATRRELAKELAEELDAIDPQAANRAERIGDLRRRMDAACDVGGLTIKEWRALIEKVAAARAEAPIAKPGPRLA